jgi:hypothetical protein
MRSLLLLMPVLWACVFLLAGRLMATVQSPPAAYAAAILGVGAVGGFCLSLIIIWLSAA